MEDDQEHEPICLAGAYRALKLDNPYQLVSAVRKMKNRLPKGPKAESILSINLLHRACQSDASKCATLLLDGEQGIRASSIHARDRGGRTPLHTAAENHSANCIELLLSRKARTDLQLFDKGKHVPLGSALMSPRIDVPWSLDTPTYALVSCIESQDIRAIRLLVDNTKELGQVAYRCAMEGCVPALALLLRVCGDKLMEPMDMVATYDGTKMLKSIYHCLVEAALQMVLDYALSLEDVSAEQGNERIKPFLCQIELLQSRKFPTESSGTEADMMKYGQLLHKGITHALTEDSTIKLLSALEGFRQEALGWLGKESNVLVTLYQEEIPRRLLHLACKKDAIECAKILLEGSEQMRASQVNARDQLTRTPLHVVAETHSTRMVELLFLKNACADLKLVDGKQVLPLEIALASRRLETEWPVDIPIQYFLLRINETGLDAVKLLAEKTTEFWEVANRSAMEGDVNTLAILLLVAEQTFAPVGSLVEGGNIMRSINESVWNKILSIGDDLALDGDEKRKSLLFIIRLINHFGDSLWRDLNIKEVQSEGAKRIKLPPENKIRKEEGSAAHTILSDDASLLSLALDRFSEKVLGLLSKEPDALMRMKQQMSNRLLFLACEHDAVNCTRFLCNSNNGIMAPQVLVSDQFGRSPLHVAAEMHSVRCIELFLIQHEFKLADVPGPPVLEVALMSTRFKVGWPSGDPVEDFLRSLKEKGLEAVRVLAEKTTEEVLLEMAYRCAIEGQVTALALLLMLVKEKIWHPVKVAKDGQEAQRAIYNCVVDALLTAGDSVPGGNGRKKLLFQVLQLLNYYGGSKWKDDTRNTPAPLIQAAKAGDRDLLKIILSGQRDSHFNAICKAVMDNSVATLRSNLEKFKSKMKKIDLSKSATAILFEEVATRLLHIACKNNAFECAKLLLGRGSVITPAQVNAIDYLGRTPLHFAAEDHSFSCISLLLTRKARTDIRSSERLLALEVALTSERFGNWSLDSPIEDLLCHLKEKGLVRAVRPLAVETKEVWNVAGKYAMEGCVTVLATLLLVVGDKILSPARVVEHGVEKMKTVFDLVVDEATSDRVSNERRKALRYVIELFRAAEAGDMVLPVDGVDHKEHFIAPSESVKSTRKMLLQYVAEHSEQFLVDKSSP